MSSSDWQTYREGIFAMVDERTGHFFYGQLAEELSELPDKESARQLVVDLLYEYHNRPALRWQFEQWLTGEELAQYSEWRKTAPRVPAAKCTKCGSSHLQPIIYGLPDLDDPTDYYVFGGCIVSPNSPKYRCIDCGEEFLRLPRKMRIMP